MAALEDQEGGLTASWALGGPVSRRAIMFADLAESVRLYQQFEARTIDRWRQFVAVARDSVALKHGGRLVRTTGDGLLFEFGAVTGAVAAAFELHDTLAPFNSPGESEAALWLRVGIHEAASTWQRAWRQLRNRGKPPLRLK
jgi:class 3 adenylate cyclase